MRQRGYILSIYVMRQEEAMPKKTLTQQLNELSYTFGFDTPKARLCGAAGQRIEDLEKALRELLEHQGHVAINSVGDVRKQCKLMRARENAQNLLEAQ